MKLLILAALIGAAQPISTSSTTIGSAPPRSGVTLTQATSYISVSCGAGGYVRINSATGEVVFGKHCKPNDAARTFWRAVAATRPCETQR